MIDLYLKTATEADMNAALLAAGLLTEGQVGETEDGEPVFELVPTEGTLLDVIGPITKWDYSVEPPVPIEYPEWHVNVRSYDLTEEQLAELADAIITPPELPYRVWA